MGDKSQETNGIIYYNVGRKMLVRFEISLFSLRQVYKGPVMLLIDGEGKEECIKLANRYNCNYIDVGYTYKIPHSIYLNACLSHIHTPYDNTIWLDSDTIILKSFDELFPLISERGFVIAQFANWVSNGKFIKSRILTWSDIYPELMESALNFGPAINCGVFGFSKNSSFMKDWYSLAIKGSKNFIPDEVCCQIMLHKYPHQIIDKKYNLSCMYGVIDDDTRIVHFHGSKHCCLTGRKKLMYNGNLWFKYFNQLSSSQIIKDNIQFDKYLVDTLGLLNG